MFPKKTDDEWGPVLNTSATAAPNGTIVEQNGLSVDAEHVCGKHK